MISKERGFYTSLFKKTIDKNLEKDAEKLLDELKKLDPSKETINNFAISFANQIFKYRFYGLVLAIIPFTFLVIQTCLIGNQNNLIKRQNEKIEKQVYLQEASRRNNLVLLMDNILEKVNDEIDKGNSILSKPLIGRISALSQGFKPYYFLQGSNLTKKPLSPERGQLLLALANSGIDSTTLDIIYAKTTFRRSYLKGANMDSLYLKGIDLMDSDLTGANLVKANLREAKLYTVNLGLVDLRDADLRNAALSSAILHATDLSDADLRNADLNGADLRNTDLSDADLNKAHGLTEIKLLEAYSLYQTKGIPKEIKDNILIKEPKLFFKKRAVIARQSFFD